MWTKPYKYNCDLCGKQISGLKAYNILRHKKTGQTKKAYCSAGCRKKESLKNWSDTSCANCQRCLTIYRRFLKKNNFCSKSCSAIFYNKQRAKPKTFCTACGKKLKNTNSTSCAVCIQQAYLNRWKKGLETGHDKYYALKKVIRRYVLSKAKNKCVQCGWNKVNVKTKTSPLHIDHIDGDYKNSRENNLRVLCPNCHSLTETYGSLNIGRGRVFKREYNKTYKRVGMSD